MARIRPYTALIDRLSGVGLRHPKTPTAADAIAARFGEGPVAGKIRGHVVTAKR